MMVGLYACSCAQTEDPQAVKKQKKVFSSALLLSFVKDLPDFSVFAVFFCFLFLPVQFDSFGFCILMFVFKHGDLVNEHEGE